MGALLKKATPEGGAPESAELGGWSPLLTQAEMPAVLALNIALRSRGFQSAQACEFVRALYYGRFEGLEQAARPESRAPEWWQ